MNNKNNKKENLKPKMNNKETMPKSKILQIQKFMGEWVILKNKNIV